MNRQCCGRELIEKVVEKEGKKRAIRAVREIIEARDRLNDQDEEIRE